MNAIPACDVPCGEGPELRRQIEVRAKRAGDDHDERDPPHDLACEEREIERADARDAKRLDPGLQLEERQAEVQVAQRLLSGRTCAIPVAITQTSSSECGDEERGLVRVRAEENGRAAPSSRSTQPC
jgi:hypothetical protein